MENQIDDHYLNTTISCVKEAIEKLVEARQYAKRANAPEWLQQNLKRVCCGLLNRISEMLIMKTIQKKEE